MTARRVLTVLGIVLLVPVLVLGALMLAAQTGWGERWIEARASGLLDRKVEIGGISFRWGWPPGVVLGRLRISNPEWAKSPSLIDAEDVSARVAVPPLFAGRVVLPYLGARKAEAGLEADADRATWRFGKQSDRPSRLILTQVFIDDGHIAFRDEKEKTELSIDVKGSLGDAGVLKASAAGTFRGEPTKATATIPGLATQREAPINVKGEGTVGRTKASIEGRFEADASTLDLRLKLAGQNLKDLNKLTGMVMPDTPPYTVGGRLRHEKNEWIFDPFDGKVGDSDIAGTVSYFKGGKRPLFKGNLHSKVLDFNDLGPLVGAPPGTGPGETAAPEQKAQAAQREATQRILPELRFSTENWGKMDADVRLEAKRVQRPKELPIDSLSTHLLLSDSVLKLQPLDFGVAEGHITSNVTIDAQAKPVRGQIKAEVQGLKLAPLFPTVKSMQEALGTLYGRGELAGTGESVAALLGSGNGQVSLAVEGGRVSALLMALLELDVPEIVMVLGPKHAQVELRCGVGTFDVKSGVARTDPFVIDTDNSLVEVKGTVNLHDETYDLELASHPKDVSLVSLRTPILVKGSMRKPKVRPKGGPIAARVAAAAALSVANPALALLALMDRGKKQDADCPKLLAEAKAHGAVKRAP
jgi:AsmA family protein